MIKKCKNWYSYKEKFSATGRFRNPDPLTTFGPRWPSDTKMSTPYLFIPQNLWCLNKNLYQRFIVVIAGAYDSV